MPVNYSGFISQCCGVILLIYSSFLLCSADFADGSLGQEWYLSGSGLDSERCGYSLSNPCLTFANIIDKLQGLDTIYISTSDEPVELCSNLAIQAKGSLSLIGYGPQAMIKCTSSTGAVPKINVQVMPFNGSSEGTLTLNNLLLQNLELLTMETGVTMVNTTLVNCTMTTRCRQYVINVTLTDINVIGKTKCLPGKDCVPTARLMIGGLIQELTMTNIRLEHSKLDFFTNVEDAVIEFTDVVFTNLPYQVPFFGGAVISFGKGATQASLTFKSCTFENQYHWDPIKSVMNIFEASLLIRVLGATSAGNIKVQIKDSTFSNNERGLTLQGNLNEVLIANTIFKNNVAMHAGAAILKLTNTKLVIVNCLFEGNAAGHFRITTVRNEGDRFTHNGDEVQVYSSCCKGHISLIGKGGAIRVQKGQLLLQDSLFKNNTARLLGGSVFVDRDCSGELRNVTFLNSKDPLHAAQGDFLYSTGNASLNGVYLGVESASNHISILQHSGDHWSIAVYDVTISCPIGYRLRVMNTSSYAITAGVGLRRSYMLDQLSYFCESCPRNKYSTDRGSLRYKLNQGVFDYFTLMINGQEPSTMFHGLYEYTDIECHECPYGANCDNSIRALPNFWGFSHYSSLRFQLCPKGYCCTKCGSYNTCGPLRTGTLCSECIEGYTEAIFSEKCVPNTACGPYWMWPFAVVLGIFYALFLLFQKDMRDFIFTKPATFLQQKKKKDEITKEDTMSIKLDDDDTSDRISKENENQTLMKGFNENHNEVETYELLPETNGGVGKSQNDIDDTPQVSVISEPEDIKIDVKTAPKSDTATPSGVSVDMGSVYLIILLYYFQDALLFNVKTVYERPESAGKALLKAVLLGFFKFRLEVANIVENVCLVAGQSPSQKMLSKSVLVPYVVIIFLLMYVLHWLYRSTKSLVTKDKSNYRDSPFLTKLCTGFMLTLLFTYQRMAASAFHLLNCVPVGEESILFIDGNVTCYQYWQYGVMAFAVCCIIPFSLVLMIGPGLLLEERISLPSFFCACMVPPPFLIYWTCLKCRCNNTKKEELKVPTNPTAVVIRVLQAPFQDLHNKYLGYYCWAGVLIGRRLMLVLFFTFINNSLIRVLCMLLTCFMALLHHVQVRPYKDTGANIAGSASVSAMIIIGGINLVRAGFEAAEYVPQGPNATLMFVLQEVENVLMLWFPCLIMGIVLLALFLQLVLRIITLLKK